jgi:phage/plasmid-like protein (TIGR03299 family)
MSHNLSIQNGVAEMFSANELPWHKLGQVVQGLLTAQAAIQAAHLDWNVAAGKVTVNGVELPFPNDTEVTGTYQGLYRQDTGAPLSVMKGRYEIIQNSEAFSFFDSIVGQGRACYETAGALRGGRQIWILAKYNGDLEVNGDKTKMYCLLVSSHDGSMALSCQWVSVRVVCSNTLSLALGSKQNCIKIRHTAGWQNKDQEAKRVLGLTDDYFANMRESLAKLQDHSMSQEQMNDFARLLYPAKDESNVPTRTNNMRDTTSNLFNRGLGNHGANRWDALNAVSDFADHHMSIRGNNSTRLESSVMGSAAALKQKAYDLLTAEDFTAQLINSRPHTISVAPTQQLASNDFDRLLGR